MNEPESSPSTSNKKKRKRSRSPKPIDISKIWMELPREPAPLDPRTLFAFDQPLELDVGSGKGLFLYRESGRRPENNYLGIEWSRKWSRWSAARVARHGRQNVRVLCTDARQWVPQFPDASFSAVHICFPDPWWKRRHRKRRIFCEDFLREVERLLQPGGLLHIATDVEEYFGVMLKVMASLPRFTKTELPPANSTLSEESSPTAVTLSPADVDYLTHFERKYRRIGRSIFRAVFRLSTSL